VAIIREHDVERKPGLAKDTKRQRERERERERER